MVKIGCNGITDPMKYKNRVRGMFGKLMTPLYMLETWKNKKGNIVPVITPLGIIELKKGNKYPPNYPDYEWFMARIVTKIRGVFVVYLMRIMLTGVW